MFSQSPTLSRLQDGSPDRDGPASLGPHFGNRRRPATAAVGLYTAILVIHWTESEGGFSSLAGVQALFSNQWLLLAGWVHYLAFDLFVGSWEVRDAQQHRIPRWAMIPCLILTFLFGPAGLLLYAMVRTLALRRMTLPELRNHA